MTAPHAIILLVVTPLAAAIFSTALRGWPSAQRVVTTGGLLANLVMSIRWLVLTQATGPIVTQAGDWPAPFGVSVVFDSLSGMLLVAASLVTLAVYIFGFGSRDQEAGRGWFHPLINLLTVGVNFALLTGDLFNLFVAFEIMLLASYVLMCLGGTKRQLTQTYKYVMLNLIGSVFFVLAAGLTYGLVGTLNYADLAARVAEASAPGGEPLPPGFGAVATILLFVFGLKAAIFPLWFWLPDTYHTCSISVAAIFGGLLTKVGVYAMARLMPMVFAAPGVRDDGPVMGILAVAAGATMVLAGLAALSMNEIRRALSLLLISHVGYMVFGVAVMTPLSLAGTVFYMTQHMIVMAALFLCCGLIERLAGGSDLRGLGGLQKRAPWLSTFFLLAGMSLVGLPPLSGFYGKLMILREGFRLSDQGYWILSALGLLTGFLTLLAIARIWARTFWTPPSAAVSRGRDYTAAVLTPGYAGAAALTAAAVMIGLAAELFVRTSNDAARELNAPRTYVAAVLGEGAWPGSGADDEPLVSGAVREDAP